MIILSKFPLYIDTWGRGTLKIFKACEDAGMPEPIITEMNGGVEVVLRKLEMAGRWQDDGGTMAERWRND